MSRHPLAHALLAALSLTACSPTQDASVVEGMHRESEQRLRTIGQGRFDVDDFKPSDAFAFEMVDDYLYEMRLYAVNFDARVHFTAALRVQDGRELDERVGAPGWSIDETDAGLALANLLGPGFHDAGSRVEARASAVFEELSPGRFRFRLFDEPRKPR